MFKSSIRRLATEATSSTTSSTAFNISKPPSYTLAQLRSFPSLEPTKFLPLPTTFFNTESPLRRDILWSSVVYEADKSRIGSNYVVLKSDSPYSNRKLRRQKVVVWQDWVIVIHHIWIMKLKLMQLKDHMIGVLNYLKNL